MTPEEMLIRAEIGMKWRKALKEAVDAAYEDAAKIAETWPEWDDSAGHPWDTVAAAIRARITPRNTTPTDDHSKE
jgi:hypothetical protein